MNFIKTIMAAAMMKVSKLFVLFLVLLSFSAHAQKKELQEEADYYFENKDYKKAYVDYDKLFAQNPKDVNYQFRLGYCCLFYPEKKARAIEIFEDLKRTQKSADVNYYLAKAYHINYRFDDAITSYNLFLSTVGTKVKETDKPLVEDAKLGLMNCENGKELVAKKVIADIKNIGAPVNTEESEYVPVISTDESILIYTYVGKNTTGGRLNDDLKPDNTEAGYYHEDIYIAKKVNDSTFSAGQSISDVINTKGNDAAIALSPDGNYLYTFTSINADNGDIYVSKLNGETWGKPEHLNNNINTNAWEGSCSVSADGRFLYFASEREGGLGGRDLYVSEKVDGDWGPAVNLGPQINTPYDDDAPFIHPDGITLFFSSEGHKSIGGYDIMYSIKKDNNWIDPISMGIPLNTTEDDRYYVINAKGDRGYFSSNRGGAGGYGEQDIYTVTPGILGEKPVIALLKGTVFADDKPVEGKIEVKRKSDSQLIGPYVSNSMSGKYLMALSPNNSYKIVVTVGNLPVVEEDLDIEKLEKFIEIRKDFYVYSPGFENKKDPKSVKNILDSLLGKPADVAATSEPKTLTPCNGGPVPDFSDLKGKSLNDPANYRKLLDMGGNVCAQGLVFKVQIAAYRHPENYKFDHLKEFGKPEVVNYPDGITRFTQLQFNNLNEAEAARQKIIGKGQNDAWVTAFIDGKRYTLEELIMVNFLGKSIN